MINTNLVSLSYVQESLKKKPLVKVEPKDPEEHQIIEDYEGECEQCASIKPQKACTICGE